MSTWILFWSATILADVSGEAHTVRWQATKAFDTQAECEQASHNVLSNHLVCSSAESCDMWLDAGTMCVEVSK